MIRFPLALRLLGVPLLFAVCGCPRKPESPPPVVQPGSSGRLDSLLFTTGVFEGCPPEGSGGDQVLNRLKNRDLPAPSYTPLSIGEIVANRPFAAERMGRSDRWRWDSQASESIADWENRGVIVEGYLLKARQQDPESCNCKDKRRRDYHLWIASEASDEREASIVAEVSPRLLPAHPNWRLRFLSRLAQNRARVRLSGWLMWDQEHPDQIGKTRGTLWEIHPIHKIEVWSGGRWRSLDG
jgi:hypothetical protein